MDVSNIIAILGAAGTFVGVMGGLYTARRAADKEAAQVKAAHEEALHSAQKEREKAVLTAQAESRTQAMQASEQLFQQLRVFIKDLQESNTKVTTLLQEERGQFKAAMEAERTRCDQEMANINAELVAANERWLGLHKLSIAQEKRLGDIEIKAIEERKVAALAPHPGRRATDWGPQQPT